MLARIKRWRFVLSGAERVIEVSGGLRAILLTIVALHIFYGLLIVHISRLLLLPLPFIPINQGSYVVEGFSLGLFFERHQVLMFLLDYGVRDSLRWLVHRYCLISKAILLLELLERRLLSLALFQILLKLSIFEV